MGQSEMILNQNEYNIKSNKLADLVTLSEISTCFKNVIIIGLF